MTTSAAQPSGGPGNQIRANLVRTAPWLQLIGSVVYAAAFSVMGYFAFAEPGGFGAWWNAGAWDVLPLFVLFGLAPFLMWGFIYRRHSDPDISLVTAFALGLGQLAAPNRRAAPPDRHPPDSLFARRPISLLRPCYPPAQIPLGPHLNQTTGGSPPSSHGGFVSTVQNRATTCRRVAAVTSVAAVMALMTVGCGSSNKASLQSSSGGMGPGSSFACAGTVDPPERCRSAPTTKSPPVPAMARDA